MKNLPNSNQPTQVPVPMEGLPGTPPALAPVLAPPLAPASHPNRLQLRQKARHRMQRRRLLLWHQYNLNHLYWAHELGWQAPWLDQVLTRLGKLLQALDPGRAADSCSEELTQSVADHLANMDRRYDRKSVMPTDRQIARLKFGLHVEGEYLFSDCDPPTVTATFRQLQWLLTSVVSPLQEDTRFVRKQLRKQPQDRGQEMFEVPSQQGALFGLGAQGKGKGKAQLSGLGVIYFAVDPRKFKGKTRQAFIQDRFCGISPPLLLNPWPSRRGLTAVVVLPPGPASYGEKIACLVDRFERCSRYSGLECQLYQCQDPGRLCSLYWSPETHVRRDLLG
ncbi:MAG: hypothetical protein JWP58_56 [Hymenobacter sp.]|nr:hypothetical protein [Hymenobacter sp.]